ncbi:MAG: hypothetical protein LBJ89_03995 [Holosporales bacterium]|jgi:hypothetical protein|nr:hypothetical protein [Holosporales bacterium]
MIKIVCFLGLCACVGQLGFSSDMLETVVAPLGDSYEFFKSATQDSASILKFPYQDSLTDASAIIRNQIHNAINRLGPAPCFEEFKIQGQIVAVMEGTQQQGQLTFLLNDLHQQLLNDLNNPFTSGSHLDLQILAPSPLSFDPELFDTQVSAYFSASCIQITEQTCWTRFKCACASFWSRFKLLFGLA